MRWYNSNGEEISPIQPKGVAGGLQLPTSQPALSKSTTGIPENTGGSGFNVDTLTQILTTGAKVAGTVQQQRQRSGAAAERQARINACGRKGLNFWLSRKKRAEYNKCVDEAIRSTSDSKSNAPQQPFQEPQKSNTMLYVGIFGALVLVGGVFYFMKK